MEIAIPYEPQPRQIKFHECPADEVLYGGAAGGGKSEAMLYDAMANALRYNGSNIVMFRRTFPDLKRSLIERSYSMFPKEVAKYNQSDKVWTFINGSKIEFAYWDDDSNYMNYQGAEYDFIYWDELTQFKKEWYLYMLSRLRGSRNSIKRQCKAATNPGGIGHGWVLDRFIEVAPSETIYRPEPTEYQTKAGVKPLTRCFIPATVHDNPALLKADPGYMARLMELPEAERRALLEGDWYSFQGQYFKNFRRDKHVIEPFQPPKHWKRYRSIDWGFNDACAVYWHATDEDGHTFTYRELYINETLASDVADKIVELSVYVDEDGKEEKEVIKYTVASPDMWQTRGAGTKVKDGEVKGKSIAETFLEHGVPLIKADNSRVIGWQRTAEQLKDAPDGTPVWQITSNCYNLVRTLPNLVRDDKKVEDIADYQEDHAAESCRYFWMSRPSKTKPLPENMTQIQKHKQQLIKRIQNNRRKLL
jgi:phage terminase large subunit